MEIHSKHTAIESEPCEALILGVHEGQAELRISGNEKLNKVVSGFLELRNFRGKVAETEVLYAPDELPAKRIVVIGLGEKPKYDLQKMRRGIGTASKTLMGLGIRHLSVVLETLKSDSPDVSGLAQAATEAAILGAYRYTAFREVKPEDETSLDEVTLLLESGKDRDAVERGIRWGKLTAEAANFTRDLQNHPGNWMTPTRLAEAAESMANEVGLTCRVLNKPEMEELKMGGLLGVARGSTEPPKFIILEHNAGRSETDTIVLVGKGVTFDSGGISIKPSERMDEMKFDMSGAAAVIGAMKAVAQLQIPLHVVGLIPSTENLPSGASMKPGDILRASSGTTIEVLNTDAEGRLILADALAYANRFNPKAVVDLATLTGACVVALGYYATGLFGRDRNLVERLKRAGEQSGERVWELPLWDDYFEDIKGDYADIKNSAGRWGGAITAAAFLARFAEGYPWAHLDIAGTAWIEKEKPYLVKGGTGVGVRLLLQFLKDWSNNK